MKKLEVKNCGCDRRPQCYPGGNGGGDSSANAFPNFTVVLINRNGTLSRTPNFIARIFLVNTNVALTSVRFAENGIAIFPNISNPSTVAYRVEVYGGVSGTFYGSTVIPARSLGGTVINIIL
ncbi:hypothetical protein [Paenibacillus herberti]|uniref:hypothetical protein n=1 Tax=Paenibacillus herberti TaxID=1619309 RepID=UPI0011305CB9|nr:hypothetical protein [Paenibacillus herberti]